MPGVKLEDDVLSDIIFITCTLNFPTGITDSFRPAATMKMLKFLCFVLLCIHQLREYITSGFLREIRAFFNRSKIRSFVTFAHAFSTIYITFGNLRMVDERYISLDVIFIIMSIFIVAVFLIVVVSPNPRGHLKRDDNDNANRKADGRKKGEVGEEEEEIETKGHTGKKESSDDEDHTGRKELRGEEKERGEVGEEEEEEASPSHGFPLSNITEVEIKEAKLSGVVKEEKRVGSEVMLRQPCMLLCLMRYFGDMEMEMTNCLLFLSCSLGELALMMSRLPSEFDVAPAFEVVHRAFLVMGLLTAHSMAAELLGEYVLLLCMPELVAALAWLTIFLGSGDPASAVRTIETSVRKAELPLLCLVSILAPILGPITVDTDEAEGATDLLLGNMSSALVAVLSSVILPSLCMLVLRQWHQQSWRGQTTAAPSSELEGAIGLLSLCRDGPCKALIIFFLAKQMLLADTLVVPLMFSVFCLILLLAASMYARAHGLHGLRVHPVGPGEKRD